MKVEVKISPTVIITVDGASTKELFEQLAAAQEVFGDSKCGLCDGPVRYSVRMVDNNKYYELQCASQQCRAQLSYGQAKTGDRIYPKRFQGESGNRTMIGNMGWHKWEGRSGQG